MPGFRRVASSELGCMKRITKKKLPWFGVQTHVAMLAGALAGMAQKPSKRFWTARTARLLEKCVDALTRRPSLRSRGGDGWGLLVETKRLVMVACALVRPGSRHDLCLPLGTSSGYHLTSRSGVPRNGQIIIAECVEATQFLKTINFATGLRYIHRSARRPRQQMGGRRLRPGLRSRRVAMR